MPILRMIGPAAPTGLRLALRAAACRYGSRHCPSLPFYSPARPSADSRGLAGHSHYQNTRHRKAAVDAQRSIKLTKVARELYAAIAEGGGDPSTNGRLERALEAARRAGMPSARIDRALKAAGSGGAQAVEPSTYDMLLPRGVAVQMRAVSTRARGLAADLRSIARRADGDLASGKTQHLFHNRLAVVVHLNPAASASDEKTRASTVGKEGKDSPEEQQSGVNDIRDSVILQAMDYEASDFVISEDDGAVEFACESMKSREHLAKMLRKDFPQLAQAIFAVRSVEPIHLVDVVDEKHEQTLKSLLDSLDEHPEIIDVVHNANF